MEAITQAPAYLDELDPNQREAVLAPDDKPILVLAAAGSGKTRVLVTRAAYLIDVLNYTPSSIICTTFTKAAAEEIKGRIGVLVGPNIAAGIQASTIHSLCLRILKNNLREVDVIAQAAQRYMVGRITEDLYKNHNIPEKDSRRLGWRYWMSWIDWARLNNVSSRERFLDHMNASRPNSSVNLLLSSIASEALERYQAQKGGMYDFTDMMTEARKLIDANPQVLDALRAQYRYVLVDELQDTSKLQLSILRDIARDRNLFLVGDASQSLYGFREADPEDNVFTFSERYEDGRIFHLPINYRSTQEVVNRGKLLIHGNYEEEDREQYELDLTPSSSAQPGVEINSSYYETARQEATRLRREVERLLREGRRPQDIFVIARTNAALALPEEQLTMAGIPAISTGGSYWAKRPVKDVVGILALADNRADDAAFEQVYDIPSPRWNLTTRRLGKRFLEDVRRGMGMSMWDRMLAIEPHEKPHRKRAIKDFTNHMETVSFGLEEYALGDVAEVVCQDYINYWVKREGPEAYEDVEVLELLPDILGRMGTVKAVLEHVGKVQRDKAELASAKAVVLTTVHGCMVVGTKVATPEGPEAIERLSANVPEGAAVDRRLPVLSWRGHDETTEVYSGGMQECVTVEAAGGYEATCTPDHRFLCNDAGQLLWKQASELAEGDWVGLGAGWTFPKTYVPVSWPDVGRRSVPIILPARVEELTGRLLGYLVGDGNYSREARGDYEVSLAGTNLSTSHLLDFDNIVRWEFGLKTSVRQPRSRYVISRPFRMFLHGCGLGFVTAPNKEVPWVILRSPKSVVREFLRGLFETDGSAGQGRVTLVSVSPRLIRQVQQLLLQLGIRSWQDRTRTKGAKGRHQPFGLNVFGPYLERFESEVGFAGPHKSAQLAEACSKARTRTKEQDAMPLSSLQFAEVHAAAVGSSSYGAVGVARRRGALTQGLLHKFPVNSTGDLRQCIWVKVSDIRAASPHLVYDLGIERTSSYLADGFVVHNSKGLERPVVFGIAMSEGILPHWMSTGDTLSTGMNRQNMPPSTYEGRLIDERCTAYVMVTRAKELLYISGSYESGRKVDMRPSRFFEEMGLVDPEPDHEEENENGN